MLARLFTCNVAPILDKWAERTQGAWAEADVGGGAVAAGLDTLARDEIAIELGESIAAVLLVLGEVL